MKRSYPLCLDSRRRAERARAADLDDLIVAQAPEIDVAVLERLARAGGLVEGLGLGIEARMLANRLVLEIHAVDELLCEKRNVAAGILIAAVNGLLDLLGACLFGFDEEDVDGSSLGFADHIASPNPRCTAKVAVRCEALKAQLAIMDIAQN